MFLWRGFSGREIIGGGVMLAAGMVAIVEGRRVGIGTLTRMGPGFVPMALGVLLAFLGVLIALEGRQHAPAPPQEDGVVTPEWRGWICIILGTGSFVALGPRYGLVPAAFACVFISAMGDRTTTLAGAAGLAVAVTFFGVVLFYYLLGIAIPPFMW